MKSPRLSPVAHHTAARGFTLLELLVVIVIIGILATLTLGAFRYAQDSASRNRTIGAHAAIRAGLEQYKEKFGEYPTPKNPDDTFDIGGSSYRSGGAQMLYQAISGDGNSAIQLAASASAEESDGEISDAERENVINADIPPNMIYPRYPAGTSNPRMLVDGWSRPFQYSKGDEDTLNPTFDLWSYGNSTSKAHDLATKKDKTKTGPWVTNW